MLVAQVARGAPVGHPSDPLGWLTPSVFVTVVAMVVRAQQSECASPACLDLAALSLGQERWAGPSETTLKLMARLDDPTGLVSA